jgi:hypothetical protein
MRETKIIFSVEDSIAILEIVFLELSYLLNKKKNDFTINCNKQFLLKKI